MKQKLFRVGNSAGVLIPKSILEESGIKIGTHVNMIYKADMGQVVMEIPRKHTHTQAVIDKEVYTVGNDLLKRYLPAFKKLARA